MDDKKLELLVKELSKDIKSEKDLATLSRRLIKLTVETSLNSELDTHLGYSKNNRDGFHILSKCDSCIHFTETESYCKKPNSL